mmetsp:Transcript_5028/g.6505  ORF Transcript_5028/g.6505 Transcript_5028/m.6505 type:complete len:140 (+) Transcript_5028:94-513(+)
MNSYRDDEIDDVDDVEEGEEVPLPIADLANASAPNHIAGMRACKRCGILKTLNQFLDDGCENCPFFDMEDDRQKTEMYTTAFFEGEVAVMDPRESWTAKWLRVDTFLPGVYAITIIGTFDKDTIEDLESRGCSHRCRPL